MITAFHHISFTVLDADRSVTFYRDTLGMNLLSVSERDPTFSEKVTGVEGAHLKIAYLEGGGVKLELIQYLSPPRMRQEVIAHTVGLTHICFLVDDIAKMYRELNGKGVAFRSEPVAIQTGGMKGGYTVLFSGPDGNAIELIQPPKQT